MNKYKSVNQNFSLKQLQKKIIFAVFIFLVLSFNIFQKSKPVKKGLPTIQFIINADTIIEHLIFTKFGGFTMEDYIPFQDTMNIVLQEPINDMYQLLFESGGQFMVEQLWLKGEDIVIKGSIKDKELKIDTILNAPFYYYSKQVLMEYDAIAKKEANSEIVNNFLLKEIKKNIDHPFSNILAGEFIDANIHKPENLKKLQALIGNQNQQIKEHILGVHKNLSQLIKVTMIELSDFSFNNSDGQKANIAIKKDAHYLIDFWFTGCVPCIADHKVIQTELTNFEIGDIQVIGISTDYNQVKWMDFLKKQSYEWENYVEDRESENLISQHLGISSFPTYIIINGNGEILHRNNSLEKSITFFKASKILK